MGLGHRVATLAELEEDLDFILDGLDARSSSHFLASALASDACRAPKGLGGRESNHSGVPGGRGGRKVGRALKARLPSEGQGRYACQGSADAGRASRLRWARRRRRGLADGTSSTRLGPWVAGSGRRCPGELPGSGAARRAPGARRAARLAAPARTRRACRGPRRAQSSRTAGCRGAQPRTRPPRQRGCRGQLPGGGSWSARGSRPLRAGDSQRLCSSPGESFGPGRARSLLLAEAGFRRRLWAQNLLLPGGHEVAVVRGPPQGRPLILRGPRRLRASRSRGSGDFARMFRVFPRLWC